VLYGSKDPPLLNTPRATVTIAKTFRQRVDEVRPRVRLLSVHEAKDLVDRGNVMVIDVGEAWQVQERGTIPGARHIPRGELDIKADTELPRRDPAVQDRGQKIIITCGGGGKAILSAHVLAEMGFTDVWVMEGGCEAWKVAGYETAQPTDLGKPS
jgi:rhodanese-related sulfurtransferase